MDKQYYDELPNDEELNAAETLDEIYAKNFLSAEGREFVREKYFLKKGELNLIEKCPFCGGEAVIIEDEIDGYMFAKCNICSAKSGTVQSKGRSHSQSIRLVKAKWERRV